MEQKNWFFLVTVFAFAWSSVIAGALPIGDKRVFTMAVGMGLWIASACVGFYWLIVRNHLATARAYVSLMLVCMALCVGSWFFLLAYISV